MRRVLGPNAKIFNERLANIVRQWQDSFAPHFRRSNDDVSVHPIDILESKSSHFLSPQAKPGIDEQQRSITYMAMRLLAASIP
ncbi:MAG: hypothetical protein WB676_20285 [Bryobacteraceae bacterium]